LKPNPHHDAPAEPMPRSRAAATFAADLRLEAVTHAYDGVPSVRGVDLAIAAGEIVCLLGQSGCGKTTLLRLVAGVERPASGRIVLGGREVAGPAAFVAPERRGVGLVFQDYALFPHMTILANVRFGLVEMPPAEAEREALQALARVGMESYAYDYPHELSGGQQQRVALARAIAPRPAVLLMDEPFSGLDRRLRDQVRDETLAVLRETRATALVVTHDPEEAMRMGDRIVLMRDGLVAQAGSARALYASPSSLFVAGFFSELNVIAGRVAAGRVATVLGPIAVAGLDDGTDVDIAVRPSGVVVTSSAVAAEPGRAAVAGRVIACRFLGEVDHLDIAVDGLDRPLKARRRGPGPARPGDDVTVSLVADDVLVFPKQRRGPIST
jgi:iron(III) transport system ATP-binding protein